MVPTLFVAFALVSIAHAATPTVVDIEAIEAHFQQALIVPSLVPTFSPGAILDVSFSGKQITPGQALAQADVAAQPVVTVSAFNASLTGNFTIAMVDADVPGTVYGTDGVNRHWLENFMTISSGTVSNSSGVPVTVYAGPGPAAGSGPHRYVVLLYAQPTTFTAVTGLTGGVQKFDLNAYVKESGLGDIIAANYFTVEVGTDSTSLPVTSAVITSTLAAAPSGAANGASGGANGASGGASGASGSASGTGSGAAPASSQPSSASKLQFSAAALLVAAAMMLVL